VICFPNAKINLGLNIIEKRADGFHNIQTVFYPVGWRDALEAIENRSHRKGADKLSLAVTGIKPGSAKSNLVSKAYRLLDEKFKLPPVKAHLHKTIPAGAGLGGGSADAAFFINLLNEKFGLGMEASERISYASQLGSDCAFFIQNKPVYAEEKGDTFSPVAIDLSKYFIVLAYPAVHSSTAEAYKGIVPQKPAHNLRDTLQEGPRAWKDRLVNDFEKNIFYRYPELENVKSRFYDSGAVYAAMSGSGSAVFGIFEAAVDVKEFRFPQNYLVWHSE
jgi:4-diphosphocytidyl-2-C-methyl-D-erythritol kinase